MAEALPNLDIGGDPATTRVVVAMSGGVDSSVAAALCVRAGYDVVGITLQLYDHGAATGHSGGRPGSCCAGRDIHDARRVADQLAIPHYVLDYEERFRTAVIDDFAAGYARGETPLPCARCNQRIKFADMLVTARELGAAALVTGHYVASRRAGLGRALHCARESARDQSYFLFATTPEQLANLRFPLGELAKARTRAIARELDLPVADKPDSQDICFVPHGHYSDVVEALRPDSAAPGDVVHADGRVLGRHKGIARFTIGQRRGLGVATGEPLFVSGIDATNRRVIVGPRAGLVTNEIRLGDINWLGDEPAAALAGQALEVFVKVRSTQPPVAAELRLEDGGGRVRLATPEEGVAPGQACVFYDSAEPMARVLGGGWILRDAAAMIVPEAVVHATA